MPTMYSMLFGDHRTRPTGLGWAVVDLETTGLFPSTDRVVEIAVVALNPDGTPVGSWSTLVDPQRDVGAGHIHGLSMRHLRGAPTFADIAHELLWRLAGRFVVAHNARFDVGFLHAETKRAGIGWGPIEGICTMSLASAARVPARSLPDCCSALGVPLANHHAALDDAHAAAAILGRLLSHARHADPAPAWPAPRSECPTRLRTDPPLPRVASGTAALASRVGVPDGLSVEPDAALAYLDLLDRVLEDRQVTRAEEMALADTARAWGISTVAADTLHRAYINGVWDLALADGHVSQDEWEDLAMLAELLGVPRERSSGSVYSAGSRADELVGKSVCFTGSSVCSIRGVQLQRADQEDLAAEAGMVVKSGVSGSLDVLVLADPDSMSGKARKARDLGVRRIAEPTFWRSLGVSVD